MTVACRRCENSVRERSAISTGIGAAARERHGKEIQQRPLGFMADGLRDVVPPRRNHETAKILRDAGLCSMEPSQSVAQSVAVNEA